ncbi:MAG: HlyD family efflux transporter periplasmic adaptor subunit [candidate division Zixibacteria bacterium]|nr:HlyD family efflux transporter periplasmic adaptor subunit [candidate division Zixibacteria bacterium]
MNSRKRISVIAALVITVAASLLIICRGRGANGSLLVSGTVEATEAQLGFQAPGRIEDISVKEGDQIKAGAELARLDRSEAQARRDQADAQLAAARALLAEMESGFRSEEIAQARAARNAAQDKLSDAQRDLERTRKLRDGGAVSQEILDKANTLAEVAKNQFTQADEQARLVESGARKERIDAQRAMVAQGEAAVRSVDALLRNMTIHSEFDGIVSVRHREPGEIVPAGSPVLTIINRDDRWIRIYIPETKIGTVRIGQKASITSDSAPNKSYQGDVVYISTQAEFTPKTVQTTEERVKLVYAVKVRITGDAAYDLKPGMPADVRLEP